MSVANKKAHTSVDSVLARIAPFTAMATWLLPGQCLQPNQLFPMAKGSLWNLAAQVWSRPPKSACAPPLALLSIDEVVVATSSCRKLL